MKKASKKRVSAIQKMEKIMKLYNVTLIPNEEMLKEANLFKAQGDICSYKEDMDKYNRYHKSRICVLFTPIDPTNEDLINIRFHWHPSLQHAINMFYQNCL